MGTRVVGKESGSDAEEEWEQRSDERIWKIVVRWSGKNQRKTGGCGDEGGSGRGYGLGPSEYSGGIDKRDIGFGNGQGDDRSGMLGGSVGG